MSNIFLQQWAIWHHTLSYLLGPGAPMIFTEPLLSRIHLEEQPTWIAILSWRAGIYLSI